MSANIYQYLQISNVMTIMNLIDSYVIWQIYDVIIMQKSSLMGQTRYVKALIFQYV